MGVSRDCSFFGGRFYPLLSTGEARTSNFVCIFTGLIGLSEQKSIKNVRKSIVVGVYRQGLSKIFRAAIYRAHRAVVFAIAQLSCLFNAYKRFLFLSRFLVYNVFYFNLNVF